MNDTEGTLGQNSGEFGTTISEAKELIWTTHYNSRLKSKASHSTYSGVYNLDLRNNGSNVAFRSAV